MTALAENPQFEQDDWDWILNEVSRTTGRTLDPKYFELLSFGELNPGDIQIITPEIGPTLVQVSDKCTKEQIMIAIISHMEKQSQVDFDAVETEPLRRRDQVAKFLEGIRERMAGILK